MKESIRDLTVYYLSVEAFAVMGFCAVWLGRRSYFLLHGQEFQISFPNFINENLVFFCDLHERLFNKF
jgi:hypothetical protein